VVTDTDEHWYNLTDYAGLKTGWFITFMVGGLLALIATIIFCISVFGAHIDRNKCNTFGRVSGYEVQFVKYNLLDWDCLALTPNGKWLSTDQIRITVNGETNA